MQETGAISTASPATQSRLYADLPRGARKGRQLRLLHLAVVAAFASMLAGVGFWATSTTRARIDVPAGAQIDPLQITMAKRAKPGPELLDVKVNPMQLVSPPSPLVAPEAVIAMAVCTARAGGMSTLVANIPWDNCLATPHFILK